MPTKAVAMSSKRLMKAARLVHEGKVRAIDADVFVVRGDSGEVYLVTLAPEASFGTGEVPPRFSCTCRWGRTPEDVKRDRARRALPCAHVEAARAQQMQERDPFAGFPK